MLASQRTREQLLPLVAAYGAAKAVREVIDYGDQMAIAARIAARHPEVGAAERGRYQVVLLDEYQDTSHAQLVLLRALFGGGHPVTAVGDPCQSIYGWRGASAGNLRRFTRPTSARAGAPGPGAAAVHQLPQHRPGAGRGRRHPGGLRAAGPRGAAAGRPARPGRAGPGGLRAAGDRPAHEADWVADQVAALLRLPPGVAPDGAAVARLAAPGAPPTGSARPTSRCCAASAPSSPRCARRSRPAASRSRWSGSAAC